MPPRTTKVLCVHGVGNHAKNLDWQASWTQAITSSVAQWDRQRDVECHFVLYDQLFDAAPLSAFDVVQALGKLLTSGILHGLRDRFGRRRRGFFGLPDRVRWTAGMIVQWAENGSLRDELRNTIWNAIVEFEPDVICAHSLGSLVCYDTFLAARNTDLVQGRTFLSFGSQIGNPFVRGVFGGRIEPIGTKSWFHLHNRHDDVFTSRIPLVSPEFCEVDTPFDIKGMADHDAAHYLSHSEAVGTVWHQAIGGGVTRSIDRCERAVRRSVRKPKRRALLVGINDYPSPEDRLDGCVNDTFLISSVLQETGFDPEDIRVVLDERATADGIRSRLEWLLDGAAEGDERVFFYSGHGAQIDDYGLDETVDQRDECLVPHDFDWSRDTAFTDDEFRELYSQLPYGTNFVVVLDCCHSGGMHRHAGRRIRGLDPPDDVRHRSLRWSARHQMWVERDFVPPNRDIAAQKDAVDYVGVSGVKRRLGRAIGLRTLPNEEYDRVRRELGHHGPFLPLIYQACQEGQYAEEYRHGVTSYGAFTYSLVRILREQQAAGRRPTFESLLGRVATALQQLGYEQEPTLVGPRRVRRARVPWLG